MKSHVLHTVWSYFLMRLQGKFELIILLGVKSHISTLYPTGHECVQVIDLIISNPFISRSYHCLQ